MRIRFISLFFAAAAVFSGCSGGGASDIAVAPVLTGVFVDSPVSGLTYATPTQSGTTDRDGSFRYRAGEVVTFAIGAQVLGSGPAKTTVTLFDIVPGAVAVTNAGDVEASLRDDAAYQQVVNMATLLQSLDWDNDPDNGIEITGPISQLFVADGIRFGQSPDDFATDPGFRSVLNTANAQGTLPSYRAVRNKWSVLEHVYANLGVEPPRQKTSERFYADAGGGGYPNYSVHVR